MGRWKLIVFLLMLSAALTCFVSAPGYCGENPWDSDGGSSGDPGRHPDSVTNVLDGNTAQSLSMLVPGGPEGGSWNVIVFRASFSFSAWVSQQLTRTVPVAATVKTSKAGQVLRTKTAR